MRYALALTAMLVGWNPLALALELVRLEVRPLSVQLSVMPTAGSRSFAIPGISSASVPDSFSTPDRFSGSVQAAVPDVREPSGRAGGGAERMSALRCTPPVPDPNRIPALYEL